MTHSPRLKFLIAGARWFGRLTGRVPEAGTWPLVWGQSRRYAGDRWQGRDAGFKRRPFDYDDALKFLAAIKRRSPGDIQGSSKDIAQGSMPKAELGFLASHLDDLSDGQPLRGLHVGNFVGLSLAYLTDAARRLHDGSVILSVDPNIPHRGFGNPQDMVLALMTRYQLEQNWLPVAGFSLERGGLFDVLNRKHGTTAHSSYYGFGAAQVLGNLEKLGTQFDFALIDGNHDAAYLRREIEHLARLIRPGGLLFLDDLDHNWAGVVEVFAELDETRFERLGQEGRAGVVRLRG